MAHRDRDQLLPVTFDHLSGKIFHFPLHLCRDSRGPFKSQNSTLPSFLEAPINSHFIRDSCLRILFASHIEEEDLELEKEKEDISAKMTSVFDRQTSQQEANKFFSLHVRKSQFFLESNF